MGCDADGDRGGDEIEQQTDPGRFIDRRWSSCTYSMHCTYAVDLPYVLPGPVPYASKLLISLALPREVGRSNEIKWLPAQTPLSARIEAKGLFPKVPNARGTPYDNNSWNYGRLRPFALEFGFAGLQRKKSHALRRSDLHGLKFEPQCLATP